jgi:hypothetical protein
MCIGAKWCVWEQSDVYRSKVVCMGAKAKGALAPSLNTVRAKQPRAWGGGKVGQRGGQAGRGGLTSLHPSAHRLPRRA